MEQLFRNGHGVVLEFHSMDVARACLLMRLRLALRVETELQKQVDQREVEFHRRALLDRRNYNHKYRGWEHEARKAFLLELHDKMKYLKRRRRA